MGRVIHPTTVKLREFHSIGKTLARGAKKLGPSRRDRYGNVETLLSEHSQYVQSYLYCARKFAELYPTSDELNWFCGLGKRTSKTKSKDKTETKSKPLGPSHVMQLLSVKHKTERRQLAEQCANEGWSVMRLRLELAKTRDVRLWTKSPQVRKDFDPMQAMVELKFIAERWDRWITVSKAIAEEEEDSVYDRLPETVQSKLKQVHKRVVALNSALAKELETGRRDSKAPRRDEVVGPAKRSGRRTRSKRT
jgi:hypothetical protein